MACARDRCTRGPIATLAIWFITDVRGAKDDEIGAAHDVGLVFVDARDRVYLSVTGRASVMRDTAKTKEVGLV